MRTATYNVDVASDRRRRENVPRHILCSSTSYWSAGRKSGKTKNFHKIVAKLSGKLSCYPFLNMVN